jgi:hypothetical protein
VVVVVTGVGIVVCSVEVVELWVALSVLQPVIDTRAAAATHERMNFFISIIVVWFVTLQSMITPSVDQRLWGVTLP